MSVQRAAGEAVERKGRLKAEPTVSGRALAIVAINNISGADYLCHSDPSERGRTKNLVVEHGLLPEQPQTILFLRATQHGEIR